MARSRWNWALFKIKVGVGCPVVHFDIKFLCVWVYVGPLKMGPGGWSCPRGLFMAYGKLWSRASP